jgi:hypothetical protein
MRFQFLVSRVFSDSAVMVQEMKGFFKGSGDVNLIITSTMRAFKMGIFFRMFEMILDKLATETGKQFSAFCDFEP